MLPREPKTIPPEMRLYTLAEACERFDVSYSTITQCMAADKKLYDHGTQIGFGTERRTRRYTDAAFFAMLQAIGHRRRMS